MILGNIFRLIWGGRGVDKAWDVGGAERLREGGGAEVVRYPIW